MASNPPTRKTEWPKFIADALGIPVEMGSAGPWHSSGDTTDRVWFERVAESLGVTYSRSRVETMRALIEAVGRPWDPATMSSELTQSGGGGNIRVAAFEALWSGLQDSTVGNNAVTQSEAYDDAQSSPQSRERALRLIRLRYGQPQFRARLLRAYDWTCCVTRSTVVETLEAAHIVSHATGGGTGTSNGLLLRSDVHTLFDLHLLAIDPSTWTAAMHPRLRATELGEQVDGMSVALPKAEDDRPTSRGLATHRAECEF